DPAGSAGSAAGNRRGRTGTGGQADGSPAHPLHRLRNRRQTCGRISQSGGARTDHPLVFAIERTTDGHARQIAGRPSVSGEPRFHRHRRPCFVLAHGGQERRRQGGGAAAHHGAQYSEGSRQALQGVARQRRGRHRQEMTAGSKGLCLTQGDPSGIGPDIALALYAAMRAGEVDRLEFFLLADPDFLRRRAKLLEMELEIIETTPEQAGASFPTGLPVVPLCAKVAGAPGRPDPGDALATIEAISRAVELVAEGRASAVITNPIAKSVLYQAG